MYLNSEDCSILLGSLEIFIHFQALVIFAVALLCLGVTSSEMRVILTKCRIGHEEVIEVDVGNGQKSFYVHRDILTSSSDFFRNALKGPFKEAEEKRVRLSEQTAELFDIYVQWLYDEKLYSTKDGETHGDEWDRLLSLYILGDSIQDRKFRNTVIDAFIEKNIMDNGWPIYLAAGVCSELPSNSPLCRLIADFWAWNATPTSYTRSAKSGDVEDAPREFWLEVAKRTCAAAEDRLVKKLLAPWKRDRCQYHEHAEGEAKCDRTASVLSSNMTTPMQTLPSNTVGPQQDPPGGGSGTDPSALTLTASVRGRFRGRGAEEAEEAFKVEGARNVLRHAYGNLKRTKRHCWSCVRT